VRKPAVIALGALLVVFGAVFTLQGLGYLAGSAMTGVTLWAIIGPILALVGLLLIVRSVRTGRPGGPT
jgi:drug/metabolite transporter superfamily protein YnfA